MEPRQFAWKWLLVGLIALFLVGLAILPRFLGDSLRLADHVSGALSEWTGGEVKLTGPVRVQYFPDVSIRSGFALTNASLLPSVKSITAPDVRISLNLGELLLGETRIDAIRLIKPKVMLKEAPSLTMGPEQTLQARVVNLLNGALLRVLRVQSGTIYMPTAAGTETIRKVNARFDLHSGTGAISSFGSFKLRNETVEFTLDTGELSKMDDGLAAPVTLRLSATPLTAKVTGVASLANELQIDGDLEAEMANLRAFLRWTGIALADGESLKTLSASGKAHWNGTTLTFEGGSFTLDGNRAIGVLAVTPGKRPRIDGTLAFDRLALDPYISTRVSTAAIAALPNQSILNSLDTDLRISAADVTAPEIRLGRGGFTINARQGVVASEVGELEVCGGSAAGQIDVDLSQTVTVATVEGNLSNIAIEECLNPLGLSIPLSGAGVLKAELSTRGRDYDQLARELSGPFQIEARAGALPVDFARLLAAADSPEGDGWGSDSVTAFETLNAECRLGAGHIWCEKFDMQTEHGSISGYGDINLGQQTLDWRLLIADGASPLNGSQLGAEQPQQISIGGALAQPMIRRANQPTLNNGPLPANTTATQFRPR